MEQANSGDYADYEQNQAITANDPIVRRIAATHAENIAKDRNSLLKCL